ncbi:MAG TPA: hypothetical protein VG322_14500 [Candidatus Acidoferrales bacterium]|nr:hypothetical protein [Candidatus Acidoferrales bacterium]
MPSHFWIFLTEIFSHWVTFVTGSAVSLIILVKEKYTEVTVKWKAISAVFFLGVTFSIFFAWQDEYASAVWRGTELAKSNALVDEKGREIHQLESQISQKDSYITQLGGLRDSTFSQLVKSQGVINNLGTQVAQFNHPETLKPIMLSMGSLYPDTKKALHSNSWLILSNKTVTPISANFTCEGYIDDLSATIIGSGVMMGGSNRLFGNQYRIQISAPAWSSISPMLVTTYYNEDDPGTCGITPLSAPK